MEEFGQGGKSRAEGWRFARHLPFATTVSGALERTA